MKSFVFIILMGLISMPVLAQTKNFIDQPILETEAVIDTTITPDKIYLNIVLSEEDSRGKKSTEELERAMFNVFRNLQIDIDKQVSLLDFSSDFKKYFLSSNQVLKAKLYSLIVKDAKTAGKVLAQLEQADISNVSISKTEYSKSEELILELKVKAIKQAKQNAEKMLAPLNQKLGKAIFISDVDTPSIESQLQGKVPGIRIRGQSTLYGSRAAEDMMIDFEKIEFHSKVKVTFIIE